MAGLFARAVRIRHTAKWLAARKDSWSGQARKADGPSVPLSRVVEYDPDRVPHAGANPTDSVSEVYAVVAL